MFSTRLHTLRKESKLRQEDIAKQLGIVRTTYAMYEQRNREPDYNTLIKLATFFEVSIDYLKLMLQKNKRIWTQNNRFPVR